LSSARELAIDSIKKAQVQYKHYFDRSSKQVDYRVGEWIFIRFPAEETGRNRKLSHPWHGPYRILSHKDPDVTAVKVYFPNEGQIQVHQQRVCQCPPELIPGYYWYGRGQRSTGRTPRWVENLQTGLASVESDTNITDDNPTDENAEVNPDEDGYIDMLMMVM